VSCVRSNRKHALMTSGDILTAGGKTVLRQVTSDRGRPSFCAWPRPALHMPRFAPLDVAAFLATTCQWPICRKQRRHAQPGTRPENHLDPLMPQRAIA
jgi:hypothetical protein